MTVAGWRYELQSTVVSSGGLILARLSSEPGTRPRTGGAGRPPDGRGDHRQHPACGRRTPPGRAPGAADSARVQGIVQFLPAAQDWNGVQLAAALRSRAAAALARP